METSQKVTITIPLRALWQENGETISERVRTLSSSDIEELLRAGRVRFVIADFDRPLEWIPTDQCFEFWKAKVKHNICHGKEKAPLDSYPGSYCFSASLWKSATTQAIVLLEKHH